MKVLLSQRSSFIEDQLQNTENGEVAPFVKLSTIRKYYCHCLTQLNVEYVTANTTRLKESILNLNSDLEATSLKMKCTFPTKMTLLPHFVIPKSIPWSQRQFI